MSLTGLLSGLLSVLSLLGIFSACFSHLEPRLARLLQGFAVKLPEDPLKEKVQRSARAVELHERVLLLEPVKAAMAKLEAAPVGERMEALKTLREVYKKEVEREISEFRQKRQPTRLEEAKK
jgi:hypothetical protein